MDEIMIVLRSIKILGNVLSCATLVASVFPLVMMPIRIFQAYRDEVKLEIDRGKETDSPLFMWVIYALLTTGIVFSLYQLDFMCYHLAFTVASACLCLLALLCLLCDIIAVIYIWVVKCRRLKA